MNVNWRQFGMKAFPLPRGKKAPPPTGWQELAGRAEIRDGENAGISTENFSVADIDRRSLIERFEKRFRGAITTIVETPSGGRHYYFSGTTRNQQNNGWDVRGAGGYVVGIGSVVDGKPYRLLTELLPVGLLGPFPEELRKKVRDQKRMDITNETFQKITRAKAYSVSVVCIEHSRAHNTLFRFCCWMRDIGLTKTEAFAILLDWNRTNCFREDGVTPYPFSNRELTHKLEDVFGAA